jgi:preprotein translocase SecE subunit
MALSTRKDEDEEILNDVEEAEEVEAGVTAAPAISDRRRRRLLAQGIDPDAAPTSTATRTKSGPTPSREDGDGERKRSGNFIQRWVEGFRDYIGDVRAELRKVAWPTREEVDRLTRIVLIVTAAAAILLGIISTVFGIVTASVASPDYGNLAGIALIVVIIVVALLWLFRDRLFPSYE